MNKCSSTADKITRVGKLVRTREHASGTAKQSLPVSVIGLDVGDRKSNFCALNNSGEIIGEGQIPTTFDGQRQYFASMRPTRVGLESGAHSAWISRLIASLGHEVIVANAKELRKIHQSDRKNDRADARILARLARFDPELLAPIAHRSAEMQADLSLLRARDVGLCSNQMH